MPEENETEEEKVVADEATEAAKEAPAKEVVAEEAPAKEAPAKEAPAEEVVAEKKEAEAGTEKAAEGSSGDAAAPAEGEKKDDGKPRTAEDIFLELEGAEGIEKPKVLKAKSSKNVHSGIVHVSATFNNTIVTVSDLKGNVIGWSSSGKMGFRGSRKSTAYASQLVSQDACRQAMAHGLKEAEVRVKGPGAGRESAVRAVQGLGIEVLKIKDVTPVPHNGCRPKKARRV